MKKYALVIGLLALAVVGVAQHGLQNLDFELGALGELPPGWFSPTASNPNGYTAKLTDQDPKSGKLCAVIESGSEPAPFGNLMQSVDAAPYRGKQVRYKAAVRTERGMQGRGQLWMRVDRSNNAVGFFDNMNDRPITSAAWSHYEIVGDIEDDAKSLNLGVMLIGTGRVWIDDVSIEILGDAQKLPAEAARPLDARGLQNLIAFTRLFGYVRHFHPSGEAAGTDWESFAVAGVKAVEDAKTSAELLSTLDTLFAPIAPAVQVYLADKPPPAPVTASGSDGKSWIWRHRGYGQGQKNSPYQSERVIVELAADKVPPPYEADLGAGIRCRVPLALPASAREKAIEQPAKRKYTGDDRATRLADVISAWNIFQHFYPYFDVVNTDWPAALAAGLRSAATDPDGAAFVTTLRRLVAALHDGHGRASGPGAPAQFPVPVLWEWIENRLVITSVPDSQGQTIAPGDAVLWVDGRPVDQLLADAESLISGATPQWIRFNAVRSLGAGKKDEPVVLDLESLRAPGTTHQVTLKRDVAPAALAEPRPEKIKELEPGVFYVDLSRISDDDWKSALSKLAEAHGIVFDMRGYPSKLSPVFLRSLSTQNLTSAQWHVPTVTTPDHKNYQFQRGGEWNLPPVSPYLTAKRAFITDGRAISYAESCMGIVEYYKLGEIVGGPTAGTNGNVNPITLPGGYGISWTGMKVLKHDGSQHHGIGIRPTIPVSRTRAGVAAGRDELLERAILAVK